MFGTHLPSIWLDGSLLVRAGPRDAYTGVCLVLLLVVASRRDRPADPGQRPAPRWVLDLRSEERREVTSSAGFAGRFAERTVSGPGIARDDALPVGRR